MNSNWAKMGDVKCPWTPAQESDNCDFVQWYLTLWCNGHVWSASQVLILLLQALPLFGKQDVAVLFGKHCYGEIPNEPSPGEMREIDQLIACSVSFSRAQALLDLSLRVQRYSPDGGRWREIYELAACYHHAANFTPTILCCRKLEAHIQETQFELVLEALANHHQPKISPGRAYDHCTVACGQRCDLISIFLSLMKTPGSTDYYSNVSEALASLYSFQLEGQGTITGLIQTLDLSFTLMGNLIPAKEEKCRTALLSPAADSLLPHRRLSTVRMSQHRIRSLKNDSISRLWDKISNIVSQKSPRLDFELSPELSHYYEESSGGLDIPTYLWALHDMLESSNGKSPGPLHLLEVPGFSNSYVEMIRNFLPEPILTDKASQIASYILDANQKEVGTKGSVEETQKAETRQESDAMVVSCPTETMLEPNIQAASKVESRHRCTLEQSGIRPSEQPQEQPIPELQFLVQSPSTGKYTINDRQKQTSTEPSSTKDKPTISYGDICRDLRAELMRCFQRPDDYDHRFIIRGTAQEVLHEEKLVRLFQSLHFPDIGSEFSNPTFEEFLARRLNEKRLHNFLAVLIFSMYDIEAVQKFSTKVLATESWPAIGCSLPTSQQTLKQLFGENSASYPFLANQAIFCPAVIVKGSRILVPSLEEQRLPYLQEEPLGQGSLASVFKVKIARGYLYDPLSGYSNQEPIDVARKDYITSVRFILQHIPDDIRNAIFPLGKKCETILESLGAFSIESSTYSLFMPLATCDLEQYMRNNHLTRRDSTARRSGFIENIQGLADGLHFLHAELKAKELDRLVCYDLDLKPESVLIFWEKTADGERLTWKISDFSMSYVKYRRQGEEHDRVIHLKNRFARFRRPNTHNSPTSKATNCRGEGTCLAPESIATPPIMSTSSDVWSLGCVISIVFTYLEEGPAGIRKYGKKRGAHEGTDGYDRFFIHDGDTAQPHPFIEEWHSRLIKGAMYRSRCEGKAVELTLRFLESAVFQEQANRCDALSVRQKLIEIWTAYKEEEVERVEYFQSSLERFMRDPLNRLNRRIIPRREAQEGQKDDKD
ncbi:kinase-like domain-containing protein [Penicillium cataractarum]|uniref:Kinase-like domain-containing protein n=1 Tax=Penicillium cataractarum TaxID=2100454 RepID=A0A9W9S011_9EURO|nr:kinase-like domain-containing protein [Penicillium cataractarum]KAJ5369227.1 kinase-like domain-containing protein [Penicillium cataractarum]